MTDLGARPAHSAAYGGALSTYAPGLFAFDGSPDLDRAVVWIAGLYGQLETEGGSDLRGMEQRTRGLGWGLVQCTMSSSGEGWASGSVRKDAEEVALLVEHLATRLGKKRLVLMGHSTGCQDIVTFFHLLKHESLPGLSPAAAAAVLGTILVAPASDREFLEANTPSVGLATHLAPPPSAFWSDFMPAQALKDIDLSLKTLTYRRWHSVAARRASTAVPSDPTAVSAALNLDVSEDFFSTDLPDAFLREVVFESIDRRTMIVLAGEDFTYRKGLDVEAWNERLHAALPMVARVEQGGIAVGGDHCFTGKGAQEQLAGMLVKFLGTL